MPMSPPNKVKKSEKQKSTESIPKPSSVQIKKVKDIIAKQPLLENLSPEKIKLTMKENPKTYGNPTKSITEENDQNGMRILERLLMRESQPPPPPRQSSLPPQTQAEKSTVQKLLEQLQEKQGPAISVIPIKKERKKQYRPRQIKQDQNVSNNVNNKKPIILNGVMDTVARETPIFRNGDYYHHQNGNSLHKSDNYNSRKENGNYHQPNGIRLNSHYNTPTLPSLLINGKYQKPLSPPPIRKSTPPPPPTSISNLLALPQMALPPFIKNEPNLEIKQEPVLPENSFAAALAQFTQMQTAAVAMAMLSNPSYFGNFKLNSPPRPSRSSSTESSNSTGDPVGPIDYIKAQADARSNLNQILLNYAANIKQEPIPDVAALMQPMNYTNSILNDIKIKTENDLLDNDVDIGVPKIEETEMNAVKTENES